MKKKFTSLTKLFLVFFVLVLFINLNSIKAATYQVTNTNASGVGSLSEAIDLSNTNPGMDTVLFTLSGVFNETSLLSITDNIYIDGNGFMPTIDGTGGSTAIFYIDGVTETTIKGLNISNSSVHGISFTNSSNISFLENIISNSSVHGLNAWGTNSNIYIEKNLILDNTSLGINLLGNSSNVVLDSNVISGNGTTGVLVDRVNDITITSNIVGLDATGTSKKANGDHGIYIANGTNVTIGGVNPILRNVVSGNMGNGITLNNSTSGSVLGNYIGTDITGTLPFGNGKIGNTARHGISIETSTDIVVGDGTAAGRNIITDNGAMCSACNWSFTGGQPIGNGITSANSSDITIDNNWVGVNAVGDTLGNFENGIVITSGGGTSNNVIVRNSVVAASVFQGIEVFNATNTIIENNFLGVDTSGMGDPAFGNGKGWTGTFAWGGTGTWHGSGIQLEAGSHGAEIYNNVIGNNGDNGIKFSGSGSFTVQGNLIGVDIDTSAAGNTNDGIFVLEQTRSGTTYTAQNGLIGGAGVNEGNLIANNGANGVNVREWSSNGHTITSNSIYCNGGKGIDLTNTANHGNDSYSVGNDAAVVLVSLTELEGEAFGLTNDTYVEVYSFDVSCGCYQGKDLIARDTILAGEISAGSALWNVTVPTAVDLKTQGISFTVTDAVTGNTSEFSNCCLVWRGELDGKDTICEGDIKTLTLSDFRAAEGLLQFTYDTTNNSWTDIGTWVDLTTDSTWDVSPSVTDPSNPTFYRVMVRTGIGCEDSTSIVPVWVEQALVGTITPLPSQICEGDTIFLSTSGFNGTLTWYDSTQVQGQWNAISNLDNTFDVPQIPDDQNIFYKLEAVFNQCLDTVIMQNVVVNTAPTFSVTTVDPSCAGNDGQLVLEGLELNTSYQVGYSGIMSQNLTSLTSDGLGQITLSNLVAGNYDTITVSQYSCPNHDANGYTLLGTGTPAFSVSLIQPGCSNDDGEFHITGLNPNTNYDLTYDYPTGVTNNVGTITTDVAGDYIVLNLAGGTISSIVVDSLGCSAIDPGPHVLNTLIPPSFAVNVTPPSCGNTDGALVISGLSPSTNYDLDYVNSGGSQNSPSIPTDGSGNITLSNLGQETFSNIQITDLVTTCSTLDNAIYNIVELPFPSFIITSTNPTLCNGADGAITLSDLEINSSYNISYKDDGILVPLSSFTSDGSGDILIPSLNAGVYDSVFVERNGCSIIQGPFTLTNPTSIPSIQISGDQEICLNDTANYQLIDSLNLGASPDFDWYLDGGIVGGGTTIMLPSLSVGNHNIELVGKSSFPCSYPDSAISNTIQLSVNSSTPSIAINDIDELCVNDNAVLTVESTNSGNSPSYVWQINGVEVSGTGSSLNSSSFEDNDSVSVTMTPSVDICPDGSASDYVIMTVDSCLPPLPVNIANALTPDNGDSYNQTFYIENIEGYPDNILWIYNRWGSLVYKKHGYLNEWDGTRNGKPLPVAVYYYVLHLNNETDDKHAGSITIYR